MSDGKWTWAGLNGDQVKVLAEAEKTLGAEYLLAYQHSQQSAGSGVGPLRGGLQVASLDESQVECLQGLEKQIQAVVIAYQGTRP